MGYPYVFPISSTDLKNAIPNPAGSLCQNFVSALLKLPLLIYQFASTMIDTGGNITATFMSMIYTPGDIKTSAAAKITSPVWLPCDGSEYPKTTYPDLYAAIGDIYGTTPWPTPSNPNNFRVPNYSCSVLIAVGTVSATGGTPPEGPFFEGHSYVIGGQYGADQHVLINAEMPPHQHFEVTVQGPTGINFIDAVSYLPRTNNPPDGGSAWYNFYSGATQPASLGLSSVTGGQISTDPDAVSFVGYTSNYKAAPHNNTPAAVAVYYYIFSGVPAA